MTVKELINELKKCNENSEVMLDEREDGLHSIKGVFVILSWLTEDEKEVIIIE